MEQSKNTFSYKGVVEVSSGIYEVKPISTPLEATDPKEIELEAWEKWNNIVSSFLKLFDTMSMEQKNQFREYPKDPVIIFDETVITPLN